MIHTKNDNNNLLKLIKYSEHFPINDLPGFTHIMSIDSKFIKASDTALSLMGYPSEDDLFCTTYEDMPCEASEHSVCFRQEDQLALKNEIKILNFGKFREWKMLLGYKKPIIQEGVAIGILAHFIDVTHSGVVDVGKFFLKKGGGIRKNQVSFLIQEQMDYHGLTRREQDCLFFLIRGCSYAEISKRLNIEVTTIKTHVEHIRDKFNVGNKSQVIEKAIALGFMSVIPEHLRNTL